MKIRKNLIIILLILNIIMMVFNINVSNAADNAKIVLSADKTQISSGDKVTITVKVTNINGIENGIIALSGTLSYDNTIFEGISFTSLNSWDNPEYNETNGKFVTTKGNYVTNDEAIFTISLTAKSDVNLGNTKIQLSDLQVANTDNEYSVSNTDVTISVVEKQQENQNNTTSNNVVENNNVVDNNVVENNNIVENNTSNNVVTNNTTRNNTLVDNTTKNDVLPKTGLGGSAFIVVGVMLIVTGIFGYMKYNKYKNI